MAIMQKNKFPNEIPVFPLANAIFFPNTVLPLNIFEPRYKKMTEDALASNKMIGMIQTRQFGPKNGLFSIGCLGKIDAYSKTPDGRYLINLKGVVRFRVLDEINIELPYRKFRVSYDEFFNDLEEIKFDEKNDILHLLDKTKKLFKIHGLSTDWKTVEKIGFDQLINSLSMICPFSVGEKQSLLEAKSLKDRNILINQIINFYITSNNISSNGKLH